MELWKCWLLVLLVADPREASPPVGSARGHNRDSPYNKYANVGREFWPRPKNPVFQERVYFGDTLSSVSKLAQRDAYQADATHRRQELKELTRESDPALPIIAMIVNWGQVHLFFNWVCGIREEGKHKILKNTLVFTGDNETFSAVRGIAPAYFVARSSLGDLPPDAAAAFGDRVFGRMMVLKVAAIYSVLIELDRDILYQDVDVVWNMDPVPLFYRTPYVQKDALFSYDGNVNQPPFYFNAGFMFIRATAKGKALAEDFFYYFCKRNINAVQPVMNAVLEHHYLVNGLDMEVMPTAVVPHPADIRLREGGTLGRELDGETPLVVHAAWTHNHWDKVKKLHAVGKWWFNQQGCDLYEPRRHLFEPGLRSCMENINCDGWRSGPQ